MRNWNSITFSHFFFQVFYVFYFSQTLNDLPFYLILSRRIVNSLLFVIELEISFELLLFQCFLSVLRVFFLKADTATKSLFSLDQKS